MTRFSKLTPPQCRCRPQPGESPTLPSPLVSANFRRLTDDCEGKSPCRRAIVETFRRPDALSARIRSFSSSVRRRRSRKSPIRETSVAEGLPCNTKHWGLAIHPRHYSPRPESFFTFFRILSKDTSATLVTGGSLCPSRASYRWL